MNQCRIISGRKKIPGRGENTAGLPERKTETCKDDGKKCVIIMRV